MINFEMQKPTCFTFWLCIHLDFNDITCATRCEKNKITMMCVWWTNIMICFLSAKSEEAKLLFPLSSFCNFRTKLVVFPCFQFKKTSNSTFYNLYSFYKFYKFLFHIINFLLELLLFWFPWFESKLLLLFYSYTLIYKALMPNKTCTAVKY